MDLMCYGSDEDLSAQLWYRPLNCGLRLAVRGDGRPPDVHFPFGRRAGLAKVDGKLTLELA